jgi:hypothetical protein
VKQIGGWILPEEGAYIFWGQDRVCVKQGVEPITPIFTVPSPATFLSQPKQATNYASPITAPHHSHGAGRAYSRCRTCSDLQHVRQRESAGDGAPMMELPLRSGEGG